MVQKNMLLRIISLSILIFLFSCSEVPKDLKGDISTPPVAVERQEKSWERIFFQAIARRIEGSNIVNLRDKELPQNTREVRVWTGFDTSPLKGIILKGKNENWEAEYIPPIKDQSTGSRNTRLLEAPASGWEKLWSRLESLNLFTLPDSTDIGDFHPYPDAEGVIVEIKTNDTYRTYIYGGFDKSKSEEAKKVLEICNILSKEFQIKLLRD